MSCREKGRGSHNYTMGQLHYFWTFYFIIIPKKSSVCLEVKKGVFHIQLSYFWTFNFYYLCKKLRRISCREKVRAFHSTTMKYFFIKKASSLYNVINWKNNMKKSALLEIYKVSNKQILPENISPSMLGILSHKHILPNLK